MNNKPKAQRGKGRGNAVFNPTYSERRTAPVRATFSTADIAAAVDENVRRVWSGAEGSTNEKPN